MLAYLNCHVYIQFVIVFTIVGRFATDSGLLVCLSAADGWLKLDITLITA